MKYIYTIVCSLSLFFLTACDNSGKPKKDYVINLKAEQCSVELRTTFPLIYCFDSLLVTASCIEAPLLRVYENNQEVYSYGNTGRGPKEFLSFFPTSIIGDTLLINDTHNRTLVYMKVGNDGDDIYIKEVKRQTYSLTKSEEQDMSRALGCVVKVNDNYFAGLAMWSDTSLFGLCDSQMNTVRYFGALPNKTGVDVMSLMSNFGGIIQSRNNKVVYAMSRFAYISAYDVKLDGDVSLQWSDEIFPMSYDIVNGSVNLNRETAFGMCRGLYLTDEYIYLLVQETLTWDDYNRQVDSQLHPNVIYVYNYDGRRLCKMITDRGLMSFCVDQSNSTIYGVTAYDIQLIKYDITDVKLQAL